MSNLTNLVVAGQLDLGAGDFLVHAAPAAVAATIVGWFAYRRRSPVPSTVAAPAPSRPDRRALRIGVPVVVWLLVGFTVGERLGVPAWVVARIALVVLVVVTRRLPVAHVPVGPAVLALVARHARRRRRTGLAPRPPARPRGVGGEARTFGAAVLGANLVNNLPAVVVSLLPSLDAHPDRVWALLLGVNIGPTLWATGALSTLLWQSTMARLGHPVGARRYAAVGWRVGIPALLTALVVRVVLAA